MVVSKKLFCNTSVAGMAQNGEKMLVKIQDVLQTFKKYQGEVTLLWRPDVLMQDTLKNAYPHLWEAYCKIVEDYIDEGWGIFDDTEDLDKAVMLCDGYYGDAGSIVQKCRNAGKLVMLQNVRV